MVQNNKGPGIHARNPRSGGSGPGISAASSQPKKSMLPYFLGAAGIAAVVAGAVWLMSGDDYMYDPNMGTLVPGGVIDEVTNDLGVMRIKEHQGRYALEVIYDIPEGVPPEDVKFPLPTDAQVQALLDRIPALNSPSDIDKIYGHTPFIKGTQGLARFEMGQYFGAGYVINNDQLYDTGYGEYDSDYDKARPEVQAFMDAARLNGYQALSCSYDTGDYATKDEDLYEQTGRVLTLSAGSQKFAMHWYQDKPLEAGTYQDNLETIGRMYKGFWQHDETDQLHPFLEIRYPRDDCPAYYQRVTDPYEPRMQFTKP